MPPVLSYNGGMSTAYIDFFSNSNDVPVDERIAHFDYKPNEDDLGIWLGGALIGGSNHELVDEEHSFTVVPRSIPIKAFFIFMYSLVAIMMISSFFVSDDAHVIWGVAWGAALIIVPFMGAVLWAINQATGDAPYLKLNKQTGLVELPRVEMTLPQKQLKGIVFLDRFVDGARMYQVALLCEDQGKWTYIHLYNDSGTSQTGINIFGFRGQFQQIADHLGIETCRLRFACKDSEALESYLAGNKAATDRPVLN